MLMPKISAQTLEISTYVLVLDCGRTQGMVRAEDPYATRFESFDLRPTRAGDSHLNGLTLTNF